MKTIELRNGKFARVPSELFEALSRYVWSEHKSGAVVRYESTGTGNRTIMLHREILDAPKGNQIRHLDGDKLNNTLENLEIIVRQAKPRENACLSSSRSGILGVCWNGRLAKWHMQFNLNYARVERYFDCPLEASRCYDQLARDHMGEHARTNCLSELTPAHLARLERCKL